MHTTWYNIEEVPYCFSKSSIKFQEHMGWKITIIVCFRFVIFRKQRDPFPNVQFVGIYAGVQSLINDHPQWTY